MDENDPAREAITHICEASEKEGALQERTFEYTIEGLSNTTGGDGYRLSDGNPDKASFAEIGDVIVGLTLGEDIRSIAVPGLEATNTEGSTAADFIAMVEAAKVILNAPQAVVQGHSSRDPYVEGTIAIESDGRRPQARR